MKIRRKYDIFFLLLMLYFKIITLAIDVLLKMTMNVFVDEIPEEQQKKIQEKLNTVSFPGKKSKSSNGIFFFFCY
jgi:hypothetical protein